MVVNKTSVQEIEKHDFYEFIGNQNILQIADVVQYFYS